MAGNNLVYDTNALIQVVPNLKRATSFLLDRFFPNIVMSDTEFVSIDVDVGKRRMSPFVSPLVEGKLVEQRRMQTNTFKPAYLKDKRAPDLRKPVRRMIGERIAGNMTGVEREMANLEFEMSDQVDMLDSRFGCRIIKHPSLNGLPGVESRSGAVPSLRQPSRYDREKSAGYRGPKRAPAT